MSTYGPYVPVKLIAPNPLGGEVWTARRDGDNEEKFVIKTLTDVRLPPEQAQQRVEVFLAQARLQKEAAGEGGNGWAPIFLSGKDGESGAFYVTLFYPSSLQSLINSRRRLRPQETKNIALGVVSALSRLDRAHGNLRPPNVLLDNPADLSATRLALTDPSERGDDRLADFHSLGQMLYHLVTGREFRAGDWKQPNAHFWKWPYDGLTGQWATLIRRLLAGDVDADIEKLQHDIQKLPFVLNPPRIVAVLATITVASALAVWIVVGMVARQRAAKQWNQQRPLAVAQNAPKSLEDSEHATKNEHATKKLEGLPPDTRQQWARGINQQLSNLEKQAEKLKENKAELHAIAGLRKDLSQYQDEKWVTDAKGRQEQFVSRQEDLQKQIAARMDKQKKEDSRLASVNLQDGQLRARWTNLPKAGRLAAIGWIVPLDESIQNLSPIDEKAYPDLDGLPGQLLEAEKHAEISKALTMRKWDAEIYKTAYGQIQTFSRNLENVFAQFQNGGFVDAKGWAEITHDPLFSNAAKLAPQPIAEVESEHDALAALAAWRAKPTPEDLQQLQDDARQANDLSKEFRNCKTEIATRMQKFWGQAVAAATPDYTDILNAYNLRSSCFVSGDAEARKLLPPKLWYNVQLALLQQGLDSHRSGDDKTEFGNLAQAVIDAALPLEIDTSQLRDAIQNQGPVVSNNVKSKPQLIDLLHYEKPADAGIDGDVQVFSWKPIPRGEKSYLHFIKVGDSYISQTEVSVGLFIKMLQSATRSPRPPEIWTEVLKFMKWKYPVNELTDTIDSRKGPRAWQLQLTSIGDHPDPGDLHAARYWLENINMMPMPPGNQYYFPGLRKDSSAGDMQVHRDLDPRHADGGFSEPDDDPDKSFPVQQVSARLALYWAGLIGCRLPTVEEWKAALERTINSPALPDSPSQWKTSLQKIHPYPHLRGQLWCYEWKYLNTDPTKSSTLAPAAGPDAGIFPIADDKHQRNPLAEDDGIFWFKRVPPGGPAAHGPEQFDDLVGNVAEFVLNDASAFDANQSNDPAKLLNLVNTKLTNNVCVIGGSALSASADVATPMPVHDLDQPYSDVGIRLAFKAPQISYAERLAEAVKSLHYLPPSR